MQNNNPNGAPEASPRIVLYDGVCKLCKGWVNFIIRHDPQHRIRLCAVQTQTGRELLIKSGISPDNVNTIVLMEEDKVYFRAEAIFLVMKQLPLPWRCFSVLRFLPEALSNLCYDMIAKNRYRLFGKYNDYQQPEADHPARFLQ